MAGKVQVARRERLLRLCKSIIADPRIVDDDIKAQFESAVLKYVHTQYDDPTRVLKRLYHDEGELGYLLRKAADRFINKELDDEGDDDHERDDDGGDDDTEKRVDHHASTVADLLVEAGSFPHRAAALRHLLHKPSGQALLSRMNKKETVPMKDTVLTIMKDGSIAGVCAAIVAKGSTTISQDDLVAAASKVAHERWPELSESQAFAKVYADPTEGRVLRQAIDVAKASLAETMLGPGLPVQVVGGPAGANSV
jgi:hypothetical protein